MIAETPVYRFEDKTINITLKDSTGAVIDLSSGFDNIVIFIYNADDTILQKYSRTTTEGWQAIDTTNQATGVLSFLLDSDTTKLASLTKKYIEVLARKTDGDVPDSKYDLIGAKYLCTIHKSRSSEIELP